MAGKGDIYWEAIQKQMMNAIGGNDEPVSTDDAFWAVMDVTAAICDGASDIPIVGIVSGAVGALYGAMKDAKPEMVPNPWFIWNGHDEPSYAYTKKYLRNRNLKNLASGLLGSAGSAGSIATQVDVAGIMIHGNAVASTAMHMIKLKAIGAGYKRSETITSWVDLLMKMKAFKAGIRGTQFAGAAIPIGAIGITTGVIAAGVKLGVKLTQTKACLATASALHWRAYQEQAISGGLLGKRGQVGPASKILYEIFEKRGATRIFGKYEVDKIIKEPSGWMCVNDKLMLI